LLVINDFGSEFQKPEVAQAFLKKLEEEDISL
jgi:hypothetical protein